MARLTADALLEWVRARAQEHRRNEGLDLQTARLTSFEYEADALAHGLISEVADILDVPEAQVELLDFRREEDSTLRAIYRLSDSARSYQVLVRRDYFSLLPGDDAMTEPPE